MTLRIKCECDTENHFDIVSMALQAGGEVLNGATDLNVDGSYYAPSPGMDLHDRTFTLRDEWFNDQSQDVGTVTKAVEEATGIRLKFNAQMLSSGPAAILSYEIVNQQKYEATVDKQMQFKQEMRKNYSVSNN